MIVSDEDLHKALDRIARTEDGHLLYLYFQKQLCGVLSSDVADCALRDHNGRRRFASELIGFMGSGIEDSAGSRSPIVTFARAEPRAISSTRGAGRRITADTRVAGWDGPADAADAGG